MSDDWKDALNEDERQQWARFVAYQREHTVRQMADSAFVMSLVTEGEIDIEFALQTGMAVLMNKPIMAVVFPGATIPRKLRLVADVVVEADLDTEEGRKKLTAAMEKMRAEPDPW